MHCKYDFKERIYGLIRGSKETVSIELLCGKTGSHASTQYVSIPSKFPITRQDPAVNSITMRRRTIITRFKGDRRSKRWSEGVTFC